MKSSSSDETVTEVDSLGAFCVENNISLEGAGGGPLEGLGFAAKDVFDVAGAITGNGHPDWLRTHEPAERSAVAVERLLEAGAHLVGKTISDELAYSLTGENYHYGTPTNPADASRVPGGSSSGSAAVVAAKVVDFALGSDCAGSVRVPASYCGVLGMRPTHGRIPLDGAAPFAPSFDCVGWFARDPGMLERVGRVLLEEDGPAEPPRRLLIAEDAFALVDPDVCETLLPAVALAEERVGAAKRVTLADEGLEHWAATFTTIQGSEIWTSLGPWIEAVQPSFGPGVRERIAAARAVDPEQVVTAREHRAAIAARLRDLVQPETVILLPTVPRIAPKRGSAVADVEQSYRRQALCLLCSAGLAGLPQITLPLARHRNLPLGLSILGARDCDIGLLTLAAKLMSD